MTSYDAIIIGTGQAGPALARRLAGAGMKVAIVERGRFGGTCVNTGCTPTKTLVPIAATRSGDRWQVPPYTGQLGTFPDSDWQPHWRRSAREHSNRSRWTE